MKSFVITIDSSKESNKVADRCIKSGEEFGLSIQKWAAVTPNQAPDLIAKANGIPTSLFEERWSRFDNALSAFLSHHSLWKYCVNLDETILILEHDAVIKDRIPSAPFTGLLSLGTPSYGKFNIPATLGINPLTSKRYLPGAHAYLINPKGARTIIEFAKQAAAPTDVYLNLDNFPWLQEYYPWPVVADDSFTTIQNENGIRAKHNFSKGIAIL